MRIEIYRRVADVAGDTVDDRVVVTENVVEFLASGHRCVFWRKDAIGAAKAILAHFEEGPDTEKDAEITRIEGILHARTDTVLRLQKEVSMVSTDLGEARDTIARMRESDSEKPELRREIARLKGAVGEKDAEIARLCSALDDEAAEICQEKDAEITRLRSALADAERHRDAAAKRSLVCVERQEEEWVRRVDAEKLLVHYQGVVLHLMTKED